MLIAILFGLAALYVLVFICQEFKRFERAFQIIDLTADFIFKDTKRLLLAPTAQFVLVLVILALWAGAYGMILSLEDITPSMKITQMKTFTSVGSTGLMKAAMWFGLWWILISLSNMKNFVALYSAVTYYDNADDGDDDTNSEVATGAYHACVTHIGSMAFGSLFLWFPRIVRPFLNMLPQNM
jgi:hypothetical protein